MYCSTAECVGRQDGYLCQAVSYCDRGEYILTCVCDGGVKGRLVNAMRIANTINDSIVDGPGFRYTVFVQGCPHRCSGCHNPDTWAFDGGKEATPGELIEPLKRNPLASGLTISGGEPFCQADECAELARLTHELGLTVWTYTGYRYEEIKEEWMPLLEETDVLVDGPFIESEQSYELHFRGSRNQRLIDVKKSLESGKVVEWEDGRI